MCSDDRCKKTGVLENVTEIETLMVIATARINNAIRGMVLIWVTLSLLLSSPFFVFLSTPLLSHPFCGCFFLKSCHALLSYPLLSHALSFCFTRCSLRALLSLVAAGGAVGVVASTN